MENVIYCAYAIDIKLIDAAASNPSNNDYSIIPIKVVRTFDDGTIDLEGRWLINTLVSVSHLEPTQLDRQYKLKFGWVMYSRDENACNRFISDWKSRNNSYIDKLCRFRSAD